ncbi:MAG: type glyceraldehyde-3-phosphate dehydrogenase [Flaviaesturariibacter sp.]|nr:type glyceraldehyde-3-phosphate dehydrogenase [Flaviaesturariibacter sp.]
MIRVAINGMGRIGRLLFRRLVAHPDIEIVGVNDLMNGANLAYLLKYDSVYGPAPFTIEWTTEIVANGAHIPYTQLADPRALPWAALGVDIVLECTGAFTSPDKAGFHLQAGAKRVLLSTTGTAGIPLLIYGYNHHLLTADTPVVSPGGCMTNCATTVLSVLGGIGIDSVQVHVIHSYSSRQELVDGPHAEFRRGRAAAESIIPVPVDLALSLERLFPHLSNRIATVTTRVPVANGALADFSFVMKDEVSVDEINARLRQAAATTHRGILSYTEDAIVSLDIKGDPHAAIVDGSLTSVVGKQVKVFSFFDNEYGYTTRMIDWILYWKQFL